MSPKSERPDFAAHVREAMRFSSAHRLKGELVEQALARGGRARLLESYFGAENYQELRELACRAAERNVRGGPRVLILPGILGSTLGRRRPIFDDVIWMNPIEIARGRLASLALGAKSGSGSYEALGAVLFAYLKLKFRLRIEGFDADFYPYDWRQSIDILGNGLCRRLDSEKAPEIQIVAHSMGGLVCRAAMQSGAQKIGRLILLGTPNFGSFASVQALRGTYPVVQRIALLDLKHSASDLAANVFNTFPTLYAMLPWPEKFRGLDLFDASAWPRGGPRPAQKMLDEAKQVQQQLAPADERFFLIAGVDQETITGLRCDAGEFIYEISRAGDGTVPLDLAELPGAKTFYIEESHGSLPNNPAVARAAADLLGTGKTDALPASWQSSSGGLIRRISERDLRAANNPRRAASLGLAEVRRLCEEWISPDAARLSSESRPAARVSSSTFDPIVIGRRRQRRLELRLAYGSIANVSARGYVLGVYRDVAPSGAARELDARLEGTITEFTRRRMFAANAGEVFLLPAARHAIRGDWVLLAGLGPFDRFSGDVQQLVGEQVVRTLVRTNVEEFATVLPGAGSGWSVAAGLQNLLTGFIRGLRNADRDRRIRGLTVCEIDPLRYEEIKRELCRLSMTSLFGDFEISLDEIRLPAAIAATGQFGRTRDASTRLDPVYLLVRQEQQRQFRSSLLGAGEKSTVVTGVKETPGSRLDQLLSQIQNLRCAAVADFGDQLAGLVLPGEIASLLQEFRNHPVVVVHDAASSRLPWEAIRIAGRFPAAEAGLSRKYIAENLSVAKWLEQRQLDSVLNLLLVVNPTGDLDGADREGRRMLKLFDAHASIRTEPLRGAAATKAAILDAFRSGRYDVIHYAGHAFFDPSAPAHSGIVCHGGEVLSGADLAGIGNLPALVFFNACEAGRIRRRGGGVHRAIERNTGFAEAFLRGGVANYVGTYWPVGDSAAEAFAAAFYGGLAGGQPIGEALVAARRVVKDEIQSSDWAGYMHYGAHDFALKQR